MRSIRNALVAAVGGMMLAGAGVAMAEDAPNKGGLAFSGGVDVTSAYYFRGYLQERDGIEIQPYGKVAMKLIDGDNAPVKVTPYVGTWNSFNSEQTGDTDGNDAWFESDLFAGVDFAFGDFTLGVIFTAYTYPNGAFDTILEVGGILSYDDTKLSQKIGLPIPLKPYAAVYFEVDDQNPGASNDIYGEIGIVPSYTINEKSSMPVTLSLPIAIGMSFEDYYLTSGGSNEFFGYGSIGLAASVPLPVPTRYGAWTLNASVTYLSLWADSVQIANHDDNDAWIGKVGVAFSY